MYSATTGPGALPVYSCFQSGDPSLFTANTRSFLQDRRGPMVWGGMKQAHSPAAGTIGLTPQETWIAKALMEMTWRSSG